MKNLTNKKLKTKTMPFLAMMSLLVQCADVTLIFDP